MKSIYRWEWRGLETRSCFCSSRVRLALWTGISTRAEIYKMKYDIMVRARGWSKAPGAPISTPPCAYVPVHDPHYVLYMYIYIYIYSMYILYVYIHSYTRNTPESCGSLLGALCIALAYAIYTIVSLAYFSTISIRSVRVTNGDDRHDQSQCLGKFEVTC